MCLGKPLPKKNPPITVPILSDFELFLDTHLVSTMNHLPFLYRCNISYQQKKVPFPLLLLMEEILHHLGCIKLMKTPVNNGITYQPQLVSRMSAINRMCVYWEGQPPLVFLASFKSSGNRPSQLDDTSLLSITSCFHPFRYQVVIPAEYSPTHVTHHHHVETKNIYMTKKIHANQSINQSINQFKLNCFTQHFGPNCLGSRIL